MAKRMIALLIAAPAILGAQSGPPCKPGASTNEARLLAFYATRGFVEVDRRPRYYRDGAPAVVLRRPLVTGCGGG